MSRSKTVERMVKIIMGAITESSDTIAPANYYEATIEAELLYEAGFRFSCSESEQIKEYREAKKEQICNETASEYNARNHIAFVADQYALRWENERL